MKKSVLFLGGILLLLYIPIMRCAMQSIEREESVGQIEIPNIELKLPIYEGIEEEVLMKGIGYTYVSESHGLLAGHRGLPTAELFARLGELKIGDFFYVCMYGDCYTYKVCRIQTIRPDDVEKINVDTVGDYVSLVTCTPYGINTHRLIVTGERMIE